VTASDSIISRLYVNPEWMRGAPCAGMTDVFYPEQHGNGERAQGEQARAICAECPHRVRCLELALDNGELHGFWGGTSPNERRVIARNRRNMGWTTGRLRNIVRCGTVPGYRKHHRDGEDVCASCAAAYAEYQVRQRHAKRERMAS